MVFLGSFKPTLPTCMWRSLDHPSMASAKIFEHASPTYNPLKLPSGVKHLKKARKGPTLVKYWPQNPEYMRFQGGYYFVSDEYRRRIMKMFEDEKRGKAKPIKGEGKRKQVAGKKASPTAEKKKE